MENIDYRQRVVDDRLSSLLRAFGAVCVVGVPIRDAIEVPREYIRQIMENDINRVDNVRHDMRKVELPMRSLARNETTTATISRLCNDISVIERRQVDPDTVSSHLNALTRLFVLENQPPFHANVRSSVRVKQSEKRHFCDPSITCALLKLTPEKIAGDLEFMGLLFEALVVIVGVSGAAYRRRDGVVVCPISALRP